MTDIFQTLPESEPLIFLIGGGEMGGRIRQFDWSKTPLGRAESWSPALRTVVRLMLANRLPMLLWWGPQYISIYNDPYRPVLGNKHPWGLGLPVSECWQEIWHVLKPLIDTPFHGGPPTWDEDILLVINRYGFNEETHWLIAYSPVPDESAPSGIGGVLATVHETTAKVVGERRMTALRDLGSRPAEEKSAETACVVAANTLEANSLDIPFALLYLLDADGKHARLAATAGIPTGQDISPVLIDLDRNDGAWPLSDAKRTMQPQVVPLSGRFRDVPAGPWPDPPTTAVVLPVGSGKPNEPAGFLVAGVSSRLKLDDAYRGFLDLVTTQIAAAIANARAYEVEKRRAEALAELDRAKTTFFSNVSHEFRTPLTLILGPLDDAIGDTKERWQRDRLLTLQRNAMRLQKLVNTLLDFSRIEAGRVQVSFQPVDLSALTSELASNFRSACEKAELHLRVDCPTLPEPVYVDAEMWEKIVLNLVSNAFKFTLKGRIEVTLQKLDRHAQLVVRDTGVGIPSDQMPRLFERFHRVEGVTGRSQEGSGIGLALVRELVRLHGGEVSAESEVGRGTTFVVSIPFGTAHLQGKRIVPARLESTALRPTHYVDEALRWEADVDFADERLSSSTGTLDKAENADGSMPRILLADDNADMRQYLQRLLSENYQVEAVSDGEAALEAVKRSIPDLVLTDVMMPRLDGFGLLKALRAEPRTSGLPVVLLTARVGEENRIEGMEAGADDYLVKPFSARELLARVGAHVQIARLRQEAGESLRAQQAELREAQRVAHVGSWRWDAKTDVTIGSDELFRIYGLDPTSQAFPDFKEQDGVLYPHEEWQRINVSVQEAMRTGVGYELDVQALRNGEPIWITTRCEILKNDVGEFIGLRGTVQDISERKKTEVALQQSQERLRLITDSLPTLISYVDSAGIYRLNNLAYEEWFRHSRKEVTGRHMRELLGESAWAVIGPKVEAAFSGQTVNYEAEVDYKDAGKRWIDATYVPHFDNGLVVGLFVLVNDITTRKRGEERERQLLVEAGTANAQFRALFEQGALFAGIMQVDGTLIEANRLSLEACGYTREEVIGKPFWECPWWNRSLELMRRIKDATAQAAAGATFRVEMPYYVADGSERMVDFILLPIKDEVGRVMFLAPTGTDITDRKRAEQALRQSEIRERLRADELEMAEEANRRLVENLRHADQRKDEFLATLAHELRNPLAPIRNGLQIMRLSNGEREQVERARTMMERQLGQMVHLVDDLLDLSRISSGKIELRKERVELAKVVQHAVETSRPLVEESGHELTITMPPSQIYVDADVTRLAQVFSNLLNNAAKYTEGGGRVQLSVQRRGGEAVVSVKDNGMGIPAHMLPKVFDMFTQVDRNLERSQGGLGIGLSIVKRLVEMHGGSVGVESDGPGMGSEFVVRLPVVLSVVQTDGGDHEVTCPSSRRRILVVDDNKDAATSLAMMLKLMGNEAKTAHDGLEALDVAAAYRPDLILLDIGMPRLNGHETAKRIREQPWGKNVVLVALTGWGQDEDRRKSDEAGFDWHMVKPVEPAALDKLLANLPADTA